MFRTKSSFNNVKSGTASKIAISPPSSNEFYNARDNASVTTNLNTVSNQDYKKKSNGKGKNKQCIEKKLLVFLVDGDENNVKLGISSILNPFKQKETHDSTIMENLISYFTFFFIFLPSILAIIVPVLFPNHNIRFDIANLITDILMVILVSWFIRFSIEWPWNWLKEIKSAKKKLIDYTNSFPIRQNSTEIEQNKQTLISNILLIRKLIKLEKIALILCFSGGIIGAILMAVVRKHIIIDETRQQIVFNNLNIGLFIFWEFFRLILTICEGIQDCIVNDVQERIKTSGKDYNIVTEENLDQYLPPEILKEESGYNILCSNLLLRLKYVISQFNYIAQGCDSKYDDLKMSYEENILQLQQENKNQNNMIEDILKSQNNEFTKINSSIRSLEKSLTVTNKPSNTIPIEPKSKICFKPFPLNFNLYKNLGSISTSRQESPTQKENNKLSKQTLQRQGCSLSSVSDTILDANSSEEMKYSRISPLTSLEYDGVSDKVLSEDLHYSLHGLPFTSTIKTIVSRDSCIIKDPLLNANINDFLFYDSQENSSNFELKKSLPSCGLDEETFFPMSLVHKIKLIYHKLTLKRYLRIEFDMKRLNDTLMSLLGFNVNLVNNFFRKTYLNGFVGEYSVKNLTKKLEYFNIYTMELYNYYVLPLRRFETTILLIFTEIPLNLIRVYFSILLFIPRVIVRFFQMKELKKGSHEMDYHARTITDKGIKKLHLVRHHLRELNNANYKSSDDKVSHHSSPIILPNTPNDGIIINSVALYDKEFK